VFLSQSADGSIINWSWQLNSNNASTAIQPALIYTEVDKHDVMLMVTTDLGCSNTIIKPLYINVHPLPVAKFTFANSKPDILTPFVEIIDESTLGYKWKYDFGDNTTSTDQNPSHNYPQVGKYKVEQVVESEFGCLDSTYRIIEVNNVYTLYIPNSFTPNNDGLNDEFISVGIGIVEFSIVIYDRWGKMIFSADDMNKSWNGMINTEYAKEDTYFYLVKARDIFKKQHSITGQVSVVY
jgi:gliding motility-associated-like protein